MRAAAGQAHAAAPAASPQFTADKLMPVALPPGRLKASDQSKLDRVFGKKKTMGIVVVAALAANAAALGACDDHRHLPANQLGRHRRQLILLILRPAVFDCDVSPSTKPTSFRPWRNPRRRSEAPRGVGRETRSPASPAAAPAPPAATRRRAAEQRDELASPHSITSSARASSDGGTASPSARAVFKLMTSSNLVDCTTGKSAGLAPLRTRPA